jgi:hypothetical protein
VAMMPPLIDPSSPDFDKVRRNVVKKIEASEAIDTHVAEPTPAGPPSGTPKPSPSASPSRDAQTDDLGKVCSAD